MGKGWKTVPRLLGAKCVSEDESQGIKFDQSSRDVLHYDGFLSA